MASVFGSRNSRSTHSMVGKNYEVALSQKLEELLTSIENFGLQNSSSLISDFQQFVQCKIDPCLESIWAYAALTYFSSGTSEGEPFDKVVRIQGLFQLIVSCSASCDPVKSVALVAPVVYVLHNFMLDLNKDFELVSKENKKVNRKIENLLDSILGYVCVCSSAPDVKSELEDFILPLGDLVSIWSLDDGTLKKNASLSDIFPLLGDKAVEMFAAERFGMRELAGIVIAELVLCKLYWEIILNNSGDNMTDKLISWLVVSLTGFRSSYCYVALTSMLLDPVFPVTLVMNPQQEGVLRTVLLDALVLVEYSFLSPRSLDQLPTLHVQYIVFTRLMIVNNAIDSLSEQGNQAKAISYLSNFTSSNFRSFVIQWIRSKIGNKFSDTEPKGSSPKAYLKWILDIEKKGFKICDHDMSSFWADFKLINQKSEPVPESDACFYVDTKGAEENESEEEKNIHAAFVEAARAMAPRKELRKRGEKDGEKRKRMKLTESHSSDDSEDCDDSGGKRR